MSNGGLHRGNLLLSSQERTGTRDEEGIRYGWHSFSLLQVWGYLQHLCIYQHVTFLFFTQAHRSSAQETSLSLLPPLLTPVSGYSQPFGKNSILALLKHLPHWRVVICTLFCLPSKCELLKGSDCSAASPMPGTESVLNKWIKQK